MGFPARLATPSIQDWLLAGGFAVAAEAEALIRVPGPSWSQEITALAGLAVLALAWRRRRPLYTLASLTAGLTVNTIGGGLVETAVPVCAVFVTGYSLGVYADRRDIAVGSGLAMAGTIFGNVVQPQSRPLGNSLLFFALFGLGTPVLMGRLVRGRSRLVERLREQTDQLRVEREARVVQAALADRLDVAHHLNEVVTRCVRALLAQVAIAEAQSGSGGASAAAEIERIAREALGEMRRLLVLLSPNSDATVVPAGGVVTLLRQTALIGIQAAPAKEGREVRSPSRWRSASMRLWPVVLATAFFALLSWAIQISDDLRGPRLLNLAAAAAVAAPLAFANRWPIPVSVVSLLAAALSSLVLTPLGPLLPSVLLALVLPFSVAAYSDWRRALLGLATYGAGFCAFYAVSRPSPFGPGEAAEAVVLSLVAWIAGRVVRDRSQLAMRIAETNQQLVEEREARAREAVITERARVSRELHDVIGHSLTVIVLQAGAARRSWLTDRERALTALATVTKVARESLTDLLASLDALEGEPPDGAEHPRLDALEHLIDMAGLAGLRVDLRVDGKPSPLRPEIELAAYRVVQEALTNVIKHAPSAKTTVVIRYNAERLELEVTNNLPPASRHRAAHPEGGRGLVGMRDRVVACQGSVEWGLQNGDEFAVKAQLPART
jgi:MYXO-CTERM domain-containing protein